MSRFDVAVIGGGLAGLSSAAALAAAGKRVVVLEQYSVVGGSTHVFRRKGVWEWQVGVHHIADCGPGGAVPTMLRGLGLGREHVDFEQMSPAGYERFVFPDVEFEAPNDWGEYRLRVGALFPAERRTLDAFLDAVVVVGRAARRATAGGSAGVARMVDELGDHLGLAMMSVTAAMEQFGLSPRLQVLLAASPCGSVNCPPDRLPFIAFASFLDGFVSGGAWFPRGGGQVLASNLLRVVEHFGGHVMTRASVEEIVVDGGRVAGVRVAGGELYPADVVISTADVKKTFGVLLTPGTVQSGTLRRVDGFRMAAPFFNAFLGADVDLAVSRPRQDHFSMPTWASLTDVERDQHVRPDDTAQRWLERVSATLPAYVHCSNIKDTSGKRYAPAGCSSLEAMFPVRMDHSLWDAEPADRRGHGYAASPTYQHLKKSLTDLMVDRARTVLPELAGRVVHREAATALTQERYTQSTQGSSYGIEYNLDQIGPQRPGPTTEVTGLFLAGASCRTGPATEGVLASGLLTAGAILRRDLLGEFADGRDLVPATALAPVSTSWDALRAAKPTARQRDSRRTPRPAATAG